MSKALLKAAAAGKLQQLTSLIEAGESIDARDKGTGRTPLIEAAIADQLDTARWLVEHGAAINASDTTLGYTALGWAASEGHEDIAALLIAAKADLEASTGTFKYAPLAQAAQAGHAAIVKMLLQAGAQVNATTAQNENALTLARNGKHSAIVTLLEQHGAGEPEALQETSLNWPEMPEDPYAADDQAPASVVRGFILAMNRWEAESAKHHKAAVGSTESAWDDIKAAQALVFDRFCTVKARPYGRQGSFQQPPEYQPSETLVQIDNKDNKRAELITRDAPGAPLRYEYLYVLQKKREGWRIDVKKKRIHLAQAAWGQAIL